MKKLSIFLVEKLLKIGLLSEINSENYNVYVYGLQKLLSKILSTVALILIGVLLGQIFNAIIFILVFNLGRKYFGGLHLKSELLCWIFSIFIFVSILLLHDILPEKVKSILTISSLLSSILLVPKLINIEAKRKRYKIDLQKSKYILFTIIVLSLLDFVTLKIFSFITSQVLFIFTYFAFYYKYLYSIFNKSSQKI